MILGSSFTGERDEHGHYILSPEGLACLRSCINTYIAGQCLAGVSVRRCSSHDLDSRFIFKSEFRTGERAFEVVIETASAVVTVLCTVVEAPGAERIAAPLDGLLAPIAEIERQLGIVQAVATERCRGLGIERQSRHALRDAEARANRACDLARAITGDPRNWRPISEGAAMYAVAEIIEVDA